MFTLTRARSRDEWEALTYFIGLRTQLLLIMKTLSLAVFGLLIFHAAVGAKGSFEIFEFINRKIV